ncbi:MAG: 16S rRNA (cytidine(1402)-2'-O)-methyltransferase [Flavobacteriaceae bacterium]|nr:16S rRNA (cytidine(1402)-2'-O)-methyltransferase [Flavobacteriaceae bacterium]|tara:strand:- start:3488 stop:4159 length:672 start_codon:yes stop_codon:yes gene_type:complete
MSKLVLIPSPIGNLEDITKRAIETIKNSDLILCEDTRRTIKLLNHLGIKKTLKSFHKFNEHSLVEKIINDIKEGIKIGLLSDAGTPGISDPGYLIVKKCIDNQIEVECLPGPTALIPALVVSGLPSERFTFEGFLPIKKGRKTRLEELSFEKRTMIFYESPHKLVKTLTDFLMTFGPERQASVTKEISKIFESTTRGTLKDILNQIESIKVKGEFVIVVGGKK